jgi:hypothetical protein
MIALPTRARSLSGAVQYNEKKVETGKATALLAGNYPAPMADLSRDMKTSPLEMRADLNRRVKVRCLHISLNFDASDKLDPLLMTRLSTEFMQRIGFADQPYLVYEHLDVPHPHLHIVTTGVDRNGKNIHLTRRDSKRVTSEMEREFDLVKAQPAQPVRRGQPYEYAADKMPLGNILHEPATPYISAEKDALGPAMTKVLAKVLTDYRFTTLEEYNALLRPFRLKACPGLPGSRTYEHHGLYYQALDEEGRAKRKYIKASQLPGKPTLAYLEGRFEQHRGEQEGYTLRVRNAVDWALLPGERTNPNIIRLHQDLENAGIQAVWTIPKNNGAPSVAYVDHQSRWAFGERVLGEAYSATGLVRRCDMNIRDLEQVLALSQEEALGRGAEIDPEHYWNRGLYPYLSM